jgi:hypothetical protein
MSECRYGENKTILNNYFRANGVCIEWADTPASNPSCPLSLKSYLTQIFSGEKEGRFIHFMIGSPDTEQYSVCRWVSVTQINGYRHTRDFFSASWATYFLHRLLSSRPTCLTAAGEVFMGLELVTC